MENSAIEHVLKNADPETTVSFDVFDTLLVRPYMKPTDLFRHLEDVSGMKGFAKERVNAERKARRKAGREITLHDIYDEIDPAFRGAAGLEKEMEMSVLTADVEGRALYDLALDRGCTVIAISDMYLPMGFVQDALERNGFDGHSFLYVSCEHGKTKHHGDLYGHVIDHLGIDASALLHIGDNPRSDVRIPESMGIRAMRFVPLRERYLAANPHIRGFCRSGDWEMSALAGTDAILWSRDGECGNEGGDDDCIGGRWRRFACRFAGPVSSMFSRFIGKSIGIDTAMKDIPYEFHGKVLFMARDGYNPMKVFRSMYDIDASYVYASRILCIAFSDTVNERNVSDLLGFFEMDRKGTDPMQFYLNNKESIEKMRSAGLDAYREYLKRIVDDDEDGDVYVVDMTTMKFSSQKLIEKALERNVHGIYYNAMSDDSVEHVSFNDHSKSLHSWSVTNMTEFLMSSREFPVIGFSDGRPLYSDDNPECEICRSEIAESVMNGNLDYWEHLKETFGRFIPDISHKTLVKWLSSGLNGDDEEEHDMLRSIYWASGASHDTYRRAIFSIRDLPYYFKNKAGEFLYMIRK